MTGKSDNHRSHETLLRKRKPLWLKQRLPVGPEYEKVRLMLRENRLHTVCQEARCPNIWDCFSKMTATFMILGDCCTRDCRFCAVEQGPCEPPDPEEPERVAAAVETMGLDYVVVTSVTRDDLPDGGAGWFARTIREIHKRLPDLPVEILVPDFMGSRGAIRTVLEPNPAVLNHNIETVPRLYGIVRPRADYGRSLELLGCAKGLNADLPIKSGLMLGLGETDGEIRRTLADLLEAGCTLLTLGQYLQPSKDHLPVARYVPPEAFENWRTFALNMGFAGVASGPFVRSSYQAKKLYETSQADAGKKDDAS